MTNIIDVIEKEHINELIEGKEIPNFKAGDTLRVGVLINDGKNERIQYFEGLCISRRNRSVASRFTVRKVVGDEGVERNFALYSPMIKSIEVVKIGIVRRAKLYYIRSLKGKMARIKEKKSWMIKNKNK